MKKTLQEQYLLIKEGKGHKDVFIKEARRLFPNMVRNAATFKEASDVLKSKQIIKENVVEIGAINQLPSTKKESYETAFENFLTEQYFDDEKAELKKVSKQVEDDLGHMYDNKDDKNINNVIFDQVMTGYYAEMKDPKNKDKTVDQLKAIVLKNLAKNPIYYTEKGQFGDLDLGYTMDAPGLGEPKEPKGPHKSSGYGTLSESVNENIMDGIYDLAKKSKDIESFKNEWYDIYSQGEQDIDADTDKWLETIYKRANSEGHKASLEENKENDIIDTYGKNRNDDNMREIMKLIGSGKVSKDYVLKRLKDKSKYKGDKDQLTTTMNQIRLENEETQVRTVVKEIIRQELNENAQKRLKEIEEESQAEVLETKAAKIQQEIEVRETRINRINEDEDFADLLDKNKIKNLKKEIKILQKAANKVGKMLDKVNKKKSKSDEPKEDIIDEGDTQDAIKSASTGVSDLSKQIDDDVISKLKEDESSMKNKLKNRFDVSDEEINDFLETHQKDIDGGADPEEEFMNYAMVNNIPHK
jgi:hypothetical protein